MLHYIQILTPTTNLVEMYMISKPVGVMNNITWQRTSPCTITLGGNTPRQVGTLYS